MAPSSENRNVTGGMSRTAGGALLAMSVLWGCGGQTELPPPRPLIVFSGARITTTPERMQTVDQWLRAEMKNIDEDPTFLIETVTGDSTAFPWETLEIEGDTARIGYQSGAPEARTPYLIYAHLHLMKSMGRLDEWLPEAADLTGYPLEKAILERTSDSWLYSRSIFDAAPHEPLDQLLYAREDGFLEALILTARSDVFSAEHEAWEGENPEEPDRYREWFRETFGEEPPEPHGDASTPS
jgi:hypothetical protein